MSTSPFRRDRAGSRLLNLFFACQIPAEYREQRSIAIESIGLVAVALVGLGMAR